MSCAGASPEGCFGGFRRCQCRQPACCALQPASRCELHILNSIWHDHGKCQGIFSPMHLPVGHVALHWPLEGLQTSLGKTSIMFLGWVTCTAS